jgi:hypothetical protein
LVKGKGGPATPDARSAKGVNSRTWVMSEGGYAATRTLMLPKCMGSHMTAEVFHLPDPQPCGPLLRLGDQFLALTYQRPPSGLSAASTGPAPRSAWHSGARENARAEAFRSVDRYVRERVRAFLVIRHKVAGCGNRRSIRCNNIRTEISGPRGAVSRTPAPACPAVASQ